MKSRIPAFSGLHTHLILFFILITVFSIVLLLPGKNDQPGAAPLDKIASDTRCPVCGMFVAKYDVWITQTRLNDDTVLSFDGVKDMMALYFSPTLFGQKADLKISESWVKDYYSLKWIDAKKAFYVSGSDVHGPMGHELIPFSSRAAAESFLADHKGKNIYAHPEITAELIDSLRSGHKMKK